MPETILNGSWCCSIVFLLGEPSLLYTTVMIFSIPAAVKNATAVWYGLISLTCSWYAFFFFCSFFLYMYLWDRLEFFLNGSWELNTLTSRHFAFFFPNSFEPQCLNKHLPLYLLPYGPAALLSHAANIVLCLRHGISCSSRPAAELWCPDENSLHCVTCIYMCMYKVSCCEGVNVRSKVTGLLGT